MSEPLGTRDCESLANFWLAKKVRRDWGIFLNLFDKTDNNGDDDNTNDNNNDNTNYDTDNNNTDNHNDNGNNTEDYDDEGFFHYLKSADITESIDSSSFMEADSDTKNQQMQNDNEHASIYWNITDDIDVTNLEADDGGGDI